LWNLEQRIGGAGGPAGRPRQGRRGYPSTGRDAQHLTGVDLVALQIVAAADPVDRAAVQAGDLRQGLTGLHLVHDGVGFGAAAAAIAGAARLP